ncbi:hypothetical protein ACP86_06020 [Marinobacter sp. CP1]|nr:hypothetical protein ACP86_06020 [Marinobacter sp. CP1]
MGGRHSAGLIPCREVNSGSGRPAPGTRATAGSGTASTGPDWGIYPQRQQIITRYRVAQQLADSGNRERPSIWRAGELIGIDC